MDASLAVGRTRLGSAALVDDATAVRLTGYLELAVRGLTASYDPQHRSFPHTVRPDPTAPCAVRPIGASERYTAVATLGLACLDPDRQRAALGGATAGELAGTLDDRAVLVSDVGAKALAAWCANEAGTGASDHLLAQLCLAIGGTNSPDTVVHAWALTALLGAGSRLGSLPARAAAESLLAVQRPSGIFPHTMARRGRPIGRAHVGCFADQVYPVQALARYFGATGDVRALDAAQRCARAVVQAQGPGGQWWWHYDIRTGGVVEGYPVYSVHQHAMAPMVLFELAEAGGDDNLAAVLAGVSWLEDHPDSKETLVCLDRGVIWRKVSRREPRRAARTLRALATARTPHPEWGWLDRVLPPGPVDRECRPYELGWLLYAWLSDPAARPSGEVGRL